jgi:hypothetical protein
MRDRVTGGRGGRSPPHPGPRTLDVVTYYEVLGVQRDATPAAIRRAYATLARRYHPDRHAGAPAEVRSANERAMQAVNEAWTVLSDPVARRRYDERAFVAEPRVWHGNEPRDAPWRPFDDSDDEIDPRLLDDEPDFVPNTGRQLARVAIAVGLFGAFFAGIGLVVLGFVINLLAVSAFGLGVVVLATLGLLVSLLVALSVSVRNDRR